METVNTIDIDSKLELINSNNAKYKTLVKKLAVNRLSIDEFINSGYRYINATRDGRLLCIIYNESASGMSRTMGFFECSKGSDNKYRYMNFWSLFKALGYKDAKNNGFVIKGCGMNMVFATHYDIIHNLFNLGFIDKTECDLLAQMTPTNL